MRTIKMEWLGIHRYRNFDFEGYDAKVESVTPLDSACPYPALCHGSMVR